MGVVKALLYNMMIWQRIKTATCRKPEKSEPALMKVMRRCQEPIALFIDDGP